MAEYYRFIMAKLMDRLIMPPPFLMGVGWGGVQAYSITAVCTARLSCLSHM